MSTPGLTGAELLSRADVALYRAKEERGTFCVLPKRRWTNRRGPASDWMRTCGRPSGTMSSRYSINRSIAWTEFRVSSFEGIGSLEQPDLRPDIVGRLHIARRPDGADCANRGMGAAFRVHGGQ